MRRYILFFILCTIHLYSFAQYEILLDKTFAERVQYLDTTFGLKTDAEKDRLLQQQTYEDIAAFALKKGDRKLHTLIQIKKYTLLLRQEYPKRSMNSERYNTLTREFLKVLNHTKAKNYKYLYPYAMAEYASHLDNIKQYNPAFEYQLRAYGIYSDYTYNEYPIKDHHLRELGGSYYRFRDYHSAKNCYKKILTEGRDSISYLIALNTYALCYRSLHNWDSAHYLFNQLADIANERDQKEWVLIAKLNIGQTYYLSHNYDTAYKYMTDAYHYARKYNMNHGIAESTGILAMIDFKNKNYQKAKSLALEGTSAFGNWAHWYYHYNLDAQNLYEVLADIYEQEGNYKKAYLYMDSLLMVVDSTSVNRSLNLSNAMQAKNKLFQSKYRQEKENARIAKEQHQQMRNGIIIGMLLLTIISVLFINRQSIKRKQLEAEKESAEVKLAKSKQQLNDFTRHLQEKNTLIEEITQELETYNAAADNESKNNTIQKLRQATILTDEDWDKYRDMFEEVYSGYLFRLKEKLPNLTPGETRFIVLSKLKLSTKEMAGILGVGTSTIRKYKHQVRNKLGLPEDGDINEITDNI